MDELEDQLKKIDAQHGSPSVQYILFNKDNIIQESSIGLADLSGNKNVHASTTYNTFSVTKTFTALAVLQLAETKGIQLEQPVVKYMPDFPYSADITIQQLLSHSAGIPNPNPLNWIHLATEHQSFDRNNFFEGVFKKN